jgi:hypothetical protein
MPIERHLTIVGKNASNETHVMAKQIEPKKSNKNIDFIDIREYWFKDGPTEESIPTRKGVMIHRAHIVKVMNAILGDLDPKEIEADDMTELRNQFERLCRN